MTSKRLLKIQWLLALRDISLVSGNLLSKLIDLLLQVKIVIFRWLKIDLPRIRTNIYPLGLNWQFLLLLLSCHGNHLGMLLELKLRLILLTLIDRRYRGLATRKIHHLIGLLDNLRHVLATLTHLQDLFLLIVDVRV